MSKVSIQGDASGTGTLTIAAPNTNSNYTLTLPTNTGTVMTSASDTFAGGLTLGGDLTLDSNGIYLGGTGSANYLDDYEAGTFTLTVSDQSSTATCYYTKVGNQVTCYGRHTSDTNSTSTSPLALNGFPFFSSSTNQTKGHIFIYNHDDLSGNNGAPTLSSSAGITLFYGPSRNTNIYVQPTVTASGQTNTNPYYLANLLKNGSVIGFTVTYFV